MANPALADVDRLVGFPAPFLDPAAAPGRSEMMSTFRTWQVYSYGHVRNVLTNPDGLWTRDFTPETVPADVMSGDWEDPMWRATWTSDGSRHAGRRNLIAAQFRHSAIMNRTAAIEEIARDLIGRIAAGPGRFNVVDELTRPLSTQMMCRIFGIDDLAAGEQLRLWVDEQTAAQAVEEASVQPQMTAYLRGLLDAHDGKAGDDLVSQLVAFRNADPPYLIDGQPVTDAELIAAMWSVLAAGMDTTSAGISNMLLLLAAFNETTGCLADLYEDPALIPGAVDEVARYSPPFWGVSVGAGQDCDFAGLEVKKGDRMIGVISAANRDPREFDMPGEFNIRRDPNQHLTFARGSVHRCVGEPLALAEMRIVLRVVLELLGPDLRWLREEPFERRFGIVNQLQEGWIGVGTGSR